MVFLLQEGKFKYEGCVVGFMKITHNIVFPRVDGITFYLVGGGTRDLILGKKPHDLDFIMQTDMSFDEVIKAINKTDITIFQVKPEFQIIIAGIRNGNKMEGVDFAFPRKDGKYSDQRRPDDTERTNSLKEDASRRDFKINALFMNEDGVIFDYVNGIDDIEEKLISAVGSPIERFKEDPLRILRAMRFATQLDFSIDNNTFYDMHDSMHLLSNKSLSLDRMRVEVNKMLKANPKMAMNYMSDFGVVHYMLMKDPNAYFQFVQTEVK